MDPVAAEPCLWVSTTLEYTSMAWTNMHRPEAALDTLVTTSICMLGFSTYGFIFFSTAGLMLSCKDIGEGDGLSVDRGGGRREWW